MAMITKKPALTGLQNALGENIGLDQRGITDASSYYDNQMHKDFGNPLAFGEDMRQRAAATMPGDPRGMRGFMQGIKEHGVTNFGKGLDLPVSPMKTPTTVWDDLHQTSAVQPSLLTPGLAGIKRLLKGKKVQS